MTDLTPHVVAQPDYLALEAEWRKEYAELMIPMTQRLRLLRHEFAGAGDGKTFEAIYQGTIQLRADLDVLKERQTSVLEKLKENRDAWDEAVSTRNGDLAKLDTLFEERKRAISANQETISELENRQQELQRSVTSLQEEMSRAKTSLRTTKDHEVALRQDFKDDAVRSLSEREQKLQGDIFEWELRVQKASDEQKEHENRLQDTEKTLEERQLGLVVWEQGLKTRQSDNDEESNKLMCARSILQTLANDVGSTADTTCTRVDLDVLAASINKLFLDMQHDCAGKDKALADLNKHHSETENKLETATQKSRKLATSLENRSKQLKVYEEKALCIPKKDLQIQQLQTELSEKSEKFKKQAKEIASYKEYCMSKKSDLETELQALKTECSTSQAETEEFRSQLEEVKNIRDNQAEQLSGLLTHTVPRLKALERISKKTVEDLTADVARHRQHADRNAAEVKDMRVSNNWLEEALKKAKQDCADRDDRITALMEDNSKLRKEKFTALQKTDKVDHDNATQRQRIIELEEDVRTKEETIQQLEASVSAARTEIQNAKDESTAKDGKITDLDRELGESKSKAVTDCSKLTDELIEKDGQIRELTRELSELQTATTTETERLKYDLNAKDDQLKGLDRANAAEIGRLTLELTGKDGEINALHAKLEDSQGTKAAEIEHLKADVTGKDGEINTLNTRLEHSQETNAAKIHKLETELNDKNGQVNELNRKKEEEIGKLQQDLNTSRNSSSQKDSELENLRRELGELRTLITTIAPKDKEIKDLRQQIQVLQDTATSKDTDLERVTQDLNSLHQTTTAEIRDLRSKATHDANEANQLRARLHSLRISSEAESTRLQQALDSERVAVTELSQKVNDQKRNLSQKERILRDHVAAIAAREAELTQFKKELEDTKRSTDSGMEQLEWERDQAQAEMDQVKEDLEERDRQLSEVQDELVAAREEVQRLEADTTSRRQTTTRLQTLTRLQPRRPLDPSADQEDEILDASVSPQQDRRGITRVHGPADAPQRSGRKRKSSEMASAEEEEPSESNRRSDEQIAAIVRPRTPARSDSVPLPLANQAVPGGIGPVVLTITPSSGGVFTMSVSDAKAQNLTSNVIPATALDALRAQIRDWSERADDWSRHVNGNNRRCVMMRLRKRKSPWDDGDNFGCKTCQDARHICVVAQKDGTLQLLPRKDSGSTVLRPSDKAYWL